MMPYIPEYLRRALDEHINELVRYIDERQCMGRAGQINYVVSCLLFRLIKKQRGCSYAVLNEFIGALECCKLELYRRLAVPYEDKKIQENGDVFDG